MRLSMLRPGRLNRKVPILTKPTQVIAPLSTTSSSSATKPKIDFNDSKTSFKNKSLPELLRGKLVFTTCQVRYLVERSESLVKLSYKILGFKLTNWGLKKTFFGHFCAGEDEESIRPTVKRLETGGVGSILDYAAESDVQENAEGGEPTVQIKQSTTVGKVQGRVYDYKNEELCDVHKETFVKAITAVHNVSPTGFAAIKVTALGDPELLKRASVSLTEIKNLFHRLDVNKTGYVSKQAFLETFNTKIEGKDVLNYFNHLDSDKDDKINYIEWTNGLQLEELHLLTAHCTQQGPLSASVLNDEERVLLSKMKTRITSLAQLAQSKGVRLMIDAEHTYFQPAIDQITNELAKKFNLPGKQPVIFSTYQMYLRDSYDRLITDMDRAKRGGYTFAAKLVRGAYMVLERQHAKTHGMPDPIHPNMQATHDNYNQGIREALRRISSGESVEIMIASHNQQSIELTISEMQRLSLTPEKTGVYFGQLLGMADQLTFSLGGAGYKAYKYVPYGRVHEVMPYLIRRAQENSDALSGARKELAMINAEIKRRIFG
jgi:proline dehydrogenase